MVLPVDAGGLAVPHAAAAVDAFGGVDVRLEDGETAEEAEYGADGADGVAPDASAEQGAGSYHKKRGQCGYDKRERASVRDAGDAAYHPAVCAVGGYQGDECLYADHHRHDGQDQHSVADEFPFRAEGEFLCLKSVDAEAELAAEPDYYVLEYPERAYYGAVDAAEDKREEDYPADYREVEEGGAADGAHLGGVERADESLGGREELELGHPSPPVGPNAEKQQCDAEEEDACEDYSDAT